MDTTILRKDPRGTSTQSEVAPSRIPNVLLAGKLGAMDAPGGGEIQMLAMAETLPSVGVRAGLWRPWEDVVRQADCLHLFGSLPEHLPVVELARRQGVPVVLSTIAWFELANCLRQPGPLSRRLASCGKFVARTVCPRLPSWRRRLYGLVDLLLPNSNAEAAQLVDYFGVDQQRIHVIPNAADPRFAAADPEPFARLVGVRDFVLCAGRIEPRKNQLGLLLAMRDTDVPVVVLGDVVPGYEWYLKQCLKAASARVKFVPRIEHRDPLLASAYASCGCLALASWFETPGLVALEAGMSGVPLVLPEGGCAREYFGWQAVYVQPHDLPGIRRAVLEALSQGRSESLARHVQTYFSWETTATITRDAYEKVL